jgi:hypothetical protein
MVEGRGWRVEGRKDPQLCKRWSSFGQFDQGRNFGGCSSDCSPFPRGAARRAEGFFFPKFHTSFDQFDQGENSVERLQLKAFCLV